MSLKGIQKYKNALQKYGIDTSHYTALNVYKDAAGHTEITTEDGSPVYSNILARVIAGEEFTGEEKISFFAENSRFYGQIMNDGNIFNPYIHRRFLPSMYIRLLKIRPANWFTDHMHWNLFVGWNSGECFRNIMKEIETITLLQQSDIIAYKQRTACFPLSMIISYLESYVQTLNNKWILSEQNANVLKQKLDQVVNYNDILDLVNSCDRFVKRVLYRGFGYIITQRNFSLDCPESKVTDYGFTLYYGAGAYYTLTSLLAFKKDLRIPTELNCSKMELVDQIKKELYTSADSIDERKKCISYWNNLLRDIINLNSL